MGARGATPDDSARRSSNLVKVSNVNSDGTEAGDTRDNWGAFGYLSFAWVNKPIAKARKQELEIDELYLPHNATADHCYDEFDAEWKRKTATPDEGVKPKSKPLRSTLLIALQ